MPDSVISVLSGIALVWVSYKIASRSVSTGYIERRYYALAHKAAERELMKETHSSLHSEQAILLRMADIAEDPVRYGPLVQKAQEQSAPSWVHWIGFIGILLVLGGIINFLQGK